MATQTVQTQSAPAEIDISSADPTAAATAAAFWSQHMRSVMAPLFTSSGTYTSSDQESHLRFMDTYIAPLLGPLPSEPHPNYTTPSSIVGSPFDASVNLVSSGKAKVRFDLDCLAPLDRLAGTDPFGEAEAHRTLQHLADIVGADTRWMNQLFSVLKLSVAEEEAAIAKIPKEVTVPPAMIGFDIDGPKRTLKAYVPAMRKAIATDVSSADIILDFLPNLEPLGKELNPSVQILKEYLAKTKHNITLMNVSVDCVDPTIHPDTRVKCYLNTPSNAFSVVRDVMTLGGRLTSQASIDGVKILGDIWPLMLNEPRGDFDENVTKPERVPGTGYSGIQFTVEMTPGRAEPDTKVYIPLFQFADGSKAAQNTVEAVLKELDFAWGHSGQYAATMESAFKEKEYGQMYLSFSYTERKGVYLTNYVAMPVDQDAETVELQRFQYV